MVKLVAPRPGFNRHVIRDGFLLGPLGLGQETHETLSEFRCSFDLISDGKGIYGENPVQHQQAKGQFLYSPLLAVAQKVPITGNWSYPDNVRVPNGPNSYVDCNCGIGVNGAAAIFHLDNYSYQYAVSIPEDEPDAYWIYAIGGYNPHRPGLCSKTLYHRFSDYYGYCMYYRRGTTYGNLQDTPFDLHQKQSSDAIIGYCESQEIYSQSNDSMDIVGCVYPYIGSAPPVSPGAIRNTVDGLVYPLLLSEFPIKEEDWGDMAMRASEKVNRTSVNMLEFISDLRHPTTMIPKLQKLGSLKDIANAYLTVHYGALPTIDDLRSIYAACQKRKPYVDKCGFSVYTSASSASSEDDRYGRTIEQHLKLAIEDEDSDFQRIIGNMESIGIFPTCENLWDLLPYSFVVDWFADVGGLLERADAHMRLERLNIRYVTYSTKWTTHIKVDWCPEFPYFVDLDWVTYHRWVSDRCPRPNLSLHSSFQDFDHWLESGALILQRRK